MIPLLVPCLFQLLEERMNWRWQWRQDAIVAGKQNKNETARYRKAGLCCYRCNDHFNSGNDYDPLYIVKRNGVFQLKNILLTLHMTAPIIMDGSDSITA